MHCSNHHQAFLCYRVPADSTGKALSCKTCRDHSTGSSDKLGADVRKIVDPKLEAYREPDSCCCRRKLNELDRVAGVLENRACI